MPPRKNIDAASSVPAFYGAELRWKREAAGLTLQELAEGNFYSVAYLSQIELGDRRMPHDLAVHADRKLGTDGFFQRRCEDVRKARKAGFAEYFADVAEMEQRAKSMEEWAPAVVPGLMQIGAYARAIINTSHPRDSDNEVDAKVTARLGRAELFNKPESLDFWVILHESVLRNPLAPNDVMAEQFRHIVEMTSRHGLVTQVLPLNSGAHPLMYGTATMMDFPDAPPLMYTENAYHGQLIDDPGIVGLYRRSYDLLRAAALPPKASLAMIEAAAEEFTDGPQP